MNAKVDSLGTDPIRSVLIKLSLPAMSSLIITATYNIIDSLFVGRFVGTEGLAAVGSNFPFFILLITSGILVGTGTSALVSRNFGAQKRRLARKIFANALSLICLISLLIWLVFLPFARFWVDLIGTATPAALNYFVIIGVGAPFLIYNLSLNNVVYAEGNGRVGFAALTCTSILNIILDAIFIAVFSWGVAGAAIATVISQCVGSAILSVYFASARSQLRLYLKFDRARMLEICKIGFPASARTFTVVLSGLTMNLTALRVGGDLALAVVSVVFRTISLIALPGFGINQAFLPIAAYNYGAKNFDRVVQVTRQAIVFSLCICYTLVFFTWIFAPYLAAAFNPEPNFVEEATAGFRIVFLGTPLLIVNLVASGLYQALGRALWSLVIAVSRILFFMIPLMLVFAQIWGIQGIWFAILLGESIAAVVSVCLSIPALKQLHILEKEQVVDSVEVVL